jgi:hypothetical protein
MSYVWPDDLERVELLHGAFAVAAAVPAPVARADASRWLAEQLTSARAGAATVVFPTCEMQYVAYRTRAQIRRCLEGSRGEGRRIRTPCLASSGAGETGDELRLTVWPGGEERLLAASDPYGRDVRWLAPTTPARS